MVVGCGLSILPFLPFCVFFVALVYEVRELTDLGVVRESVYLLNVLESTNPSYFFLLVIFLAVS